MMFRNLILITGILLTTVYGFSQTINWQKLDMDNAFGYTSTVDSDNNVITVASGPFETQATTLYVRKYDVDGDLVMQTSVNPTDINAGVTDHELPYQVETDSENNIIISGVNTIIQTSTSSSCFTPPCYFTSAAKVWKFDPNGVLIFNKTLMDHENGFDQLLVDDDFLAIDANDNIYVNGRGLITDTNDETAFGTILVKLAPDGTTLFTDVEDIVGSGNSISQGLMGLGNNFVAVANSTTFDNELTAWDASGNVLWNINLSNNIDAFKSIVVDPATNDTYVLAESFPPNPILTKVDSNGNITFTQTYSLGETALPKGLDFVAADKLAFAATTWSDLGSDSRLHTKVVNASDGATVSDHTYTLAQNLSRIRDFETNPDIGSYYVIVNSTNNGGAPASGTLHSYNLNSGEWHVTNPNLRVRSLALGLTNEIYVTTDNIWDLYQYLDNDVVLSQSEIQNDLSRLTIYPNPVGNVLNFDSDTAIQRVSIYNMEGKKLHTENPVGNTMNLDNLPKGFYTLHFETRNGFTVHKKLMKN